MAWSRGPTGASCLRPPKRLPMPAAMTISVSGRGTARVLPEPGCDAPAGRPGLAWLEDDEVGAQSEIGMGAGGERTGVIAGVGGRGRDGEAVFVEAVFGP